MARNSFRSLELIWDFKSKSDRNLPGMSEYAASKSDFYRRLGRQLCDTCAEAMLVRSATCFEVISLTLDPGPDSGF
jgi:hypothetical protein